MTATAATDGTPGYTEQWQRSVDGGGFANLANGSGVTGATTLSLFDGSAVTGHVYGYQVVYTDSASATATSAPVSGLRVYTGARPGGLRTSSLGA